MGDIRHSFEDLPEDAVPIGVVEVVEYLNDRGGAEYMVRSGGEMALSSILGLLELAKVSVLESIQGGA